MQNNIKTADGPVREKLNYLRTHGFEIKEGEIVDGAIYALHCKRPVAIDLGKHTMIIYGRTDNTTKKLYDIQGWRQLSLDAFKIVCHVFRLVRFSEQDVKAVTVLSDHTIQLIPGALS